MNFSISLQRLVFFLIATGIALSPAAFGGTPPWFSPVLFIFCGSIACIWAASVVLSPGSQPASVRRLWFPLSLYFVAVAWCLIQAVTSLPAELAHDLWGTLEQTLERPSRHAGTLNADASLRGVGRFLAYAVIFLLCYQIASAEKHAVRLLSVIVLSAAAYALFGIVLELKASQTVLWFPRTFEHGNLSSTFPNRNAFASYAVLGILGACTLLYRRSIRADDMAATIDRRVVAAIRYYLPRNWWASVAICLLFIAILMSHSRGGLLIAAVSFLIFLGCAGRTSQYKRLATFSGIGLLSIAALTYIAVGDETAKRFDTLGFAAQERLEIGKATMKAIADRPMLGTGLGTFSDVFSTYRPASLRPRIEFAHNSYLENTLEMGLPAAFAFYGSLFWLFVLLVRSMWSKSLASPYPALGLAALAAMAIHGAFDYSVQFPSVAITGSALVGIAAAQSFARRVKEPAKRPTTSDRRT